MTTDEINLRVLSAYDLIKQLVGAFPPRCIIPGESVEAAHRYAGRVDLIVELESLMQLEIEEDTEARLAEATSIAAE